MVRFPVQKKAIAAGLRKIGAALLSWDAVTAICAVILSIYIPFFSNLPEQLKQIADLTKTNRSMTTTALDSQLEANKAAVRALAAQTQISETLKTALASQQFSLQLTEERNSLNRQVSDLRTTKEKLVAEINELHGTVNDSELVLHNSVDQMVAFMFTNAYDRLKEKYSHNAPAMELIPTTDSLPSAQRANIGG